MDYETLMQDARKTNAMLDKIDRLHGLAAPADCSIGIQIDTAMGAIRAGIDTDDWACVAEGQAILETLKRRIK